MIKTSSTRRLASLMFIPLFLGSVVLVSEKPVYATTHVHPCILDWTQTLGPVLFLPPTAGGGAEIPTPPPVTISSEVSRPDIIPSIIAFRTSINVGAPPSCDPYAYVHSELEGVKMTVNFTKTGGTGPADLEIVTLGLSPSGDNIINILGGPVNSGVELPSGVISYIFTAPTTLQLRGLLGVVNPVGGPQVTLQINNITGTARGTHHYDVPGPLPLLGVGAAFGFSRKLRKRIKTSKTPEVMSAIG
jgi:hypothetical protein